MTIGPELRESVVTALADIGVSMVLRKRIAGTFEAGVGVNVTEYDYDCIGVFTKIGLLTQNPMVQVGDRRVLVADVEQDVKPEPGDYLLHAGVRYVIVKPDEVAPDGTSVCFDCLIRT